MIGDTKEGTFAIRVVKALASPAGHMVNADNATGERAIWGKRSQWVDYYGRVDGEDVGIAILDHPDNLRAPTYWHARAYGSARGEPVRREGSSRAIAARAAPTRSQAKGHSSSGTGSSFTMGTHFRPTLRPHTARLSPKDRREMSSQSDVTRRNFLETAGAATLATISFITRPERVFGANDRVRVGVCGLHGRGKDHMDALAHLPNAEVAALCDVDPRVLEERRGQVDGSPRTFVDVREMLDDRSLDAMSIATPNHWHALMAIWACQAGKDVYVEKPCSHNLWEGRQLVRAAGSTDRIVQHGTQSRSAAAMIEAIGHVQIGTFGDIYMARGLCFKRRDTIGRTPSKPVPAGVDYDLWSGPAPLQGVHEEPLSLQLALDLGHGKRRPRQPGRPPTRCSTMGTRRRLPEPGVRDRRALHVR